MGRWEAPRGYSQGHIYPHVCGATTQGQLDGNENKLERHHSASVNFCYLTDHESWYQKNEKMRGRVLLSDENCSQSMCHRFSFSATLEVLASAPLVLFRHFHSCLLNYWGGRTIHLLHNINFRGQLPTLPPYSCAYGQHICCHNHLIVLSPFTALQIFWQFIGNKYIRLTPVVPEMWVGTGLNTRPFIFYPILSASTNCRYFLFLHTQNWTLCSIPSVFLQM